MFFKKGKKNTPNTLLCVSRPEKDLFSESNSSWFKFTALGGLSSLHLGFLTRKVNNSIWNALPDLPMSTCQPTLQSSSGDTHSPSKSYGVTGLRISTLLHLVHAFTRLPIAAASNLPLPQQAQQRASRGAGVERVKRPQSVRATLFPLIFNSFS